MWQQSAAQVAARSVITDRKTRVALRSSAGRSSIDRRILALTVTFSNPTTEELLKRAEDLMRQNQEYLEDFNAALDQFLKRKAEFQAEHPAFGRYSFP